MDRWLHTHRRPSSITGGTREKHPHTFNRGSLQLSKKIKFFVVQCVNIQNGGTHTGGTQEPHFPHPNRLWQDSGSPSVTLFVDTSVGPKSAFASSWCSSGQSLSVCLSVCQTSPGLVKASYLVTDALDGGPAKSSCCPDVSIGIGETLLSFRIEKLFCFLL